MYKNFNLDQVKLTDSYFAHRRTLAKQYIEDFDIARLMHTFKINAGISSEAKPLGGWEAPECGLRGHFVGHFLSACSKFSFADKDETLKAKATEIVDIMEMCARPNGYLSAFEEDKMDILEFEEDRGVWAPYYTLHKILQGLVDCYTLLDNRKALTLAINLAHYINERFKKLSYWKIDGILRCTKVNPVNEFGGIGDVLYSLYEITQASEIFALANIFDREYFIGNIANGKDVLENLHANTHLPMVIAAMHRYDLSGEECYKTAALNFYHYVLGRTFVNGNSSSKATACIKRGTSEKSEHWGCNHDLSDALTGGESESCCAHNTERILQQLFKWYGEVEYLDHMEVLKYNAVLNSASNTTGLSQYHQPMGRGAFKNFSGAHDTFWCCTASGIEAMSEIQKNIWFMNKDSILLNMFISSTVTWNEMGVIIEQNTDFPDDTVSVLTIHVQEPTKFRLILKDALVESVKVNGLLIELVRENGFISIQRVFHDRDQIEIKIHVDLKLIPLKGAEDFAAVMYGPIVLAQLGEDSWQGQVAEGNIDQVLMKSSDSQLAFRAVLDSKAIDFIPLYRVDDEIYTVYSALTDNKRELNKFSIAKDGSDAYT